MDNYYGRKQLKELSAQQIYEYLVYFQIPEEVVRERFLSNLLLTNLSPIIFLHTMILNAVCLIF